MSVSERRTARRFIMNVPLQLQPAKTPSLAARPIRAMNVSTRGVYFATDLPLSQGQLVQVLLQMSKEVTGKVVNERRFTGRVAHVHPNEHSNYRSRSKKFPRRVPSNRDFSLKKSHNSPAMKSPARGSPQALSVATISMSFPLTPMPWDFALPTLRARASPPRS